METSLTSMKVAFPPAPKPIQGISMLALLNNLMLPMCQCSQTQKTPASATMNMLFCGASPGLYSFFKNEVYPTSYFPFPIEVDAVPNFTTFQTDNKPKTLKAPQAHNHKTRLDFVTMNAALLEVFLVNPIRKTRQSAKHMSQYA